MPRGSIALADFPERVVRLDCPQCGRVGQYHLDRLVERFGADAALPDVLVALASCERRHSFSGRCGARFTDLVRHPPLDISESNRV